MLAQPRNPLYHERLRHDMVVQGQEGQHAGRGPLVPLAQPNGLPKASRR
jgi:hypothetical protein